MTGKTQLSKNKKLSEWWVGIARSDSFEEVAALALAEIADTCDTIEKMKGARDAIHLLKTIADNDPSMMEFPSPGLTHQMPVKHPTKV